MQTKPENDTDLRLKVNRETARLPWAELLKHFAAGNVVWIANSLDLVDVAVRISHDDKAHIGQWMEAGLLAKVSDEQAANWLEINAELWAVVVGPFILVQQEKAVPASVH
ncbi:DUF2288 domain-containing protein [Duganella violaceipulchra]|uniref:DUF2288 domain-containing protein n=1 Tax=Duganella violaceipulchra TaxID=2849652 RepID=A0AA41L590_9BURK|nr:DUF2288 domain-containing protein [Duganella violaceicalia]MBV6323859.1 DUF2288 domain-containing protein [Duganella violaceicalia]MCP2007551.1 hypothetical protein [Duganella violaceicalia]